MKSFRLQFVDIDSSFSISTIEADIKGFIAVRAPKGDVEATYFEPGNENLIKAMIGYPTADWPDIYEAIAFNNEYGLYVSAAPSSTKEYPSYYGGLYITSKGFFDFIEEGDKDNLSYMVDVTSSIDDFGISPVVHTPVYKENEEKGYIKRTNINNVYLNAKPITDTLQVSELVRVTSDTFHIFEGYTPEYDPDTSNLKIKVGEEEVTFAPGANLAEYGLGIWHGPAAEEAASGYATYDLWESTDSSAVCAKFPLGNTGPISTTATKTSDFIAYNVCNENYTFTQMGKTFDIEMPAYVYKHNVKNDTIAAITQKCPTEQPTVLTINNVGVDKFSYDFSAVHVASSADIAKLPGGVNFAKSMNAYNVVVIGNIINIIKNATTFVPVSSDDFKTKTIKAIAYNNVGEKTSATYYYVAENAILVDKDGSTDYPLKGSSNFDTLDISLYEIDPIGKKVGATSFYGSMNPRGVDASGAGIYWPNVLPKDSASFIEVIPVNSIEKIADFNTESNEWYGYEFTPGFEVSIKGQRTITKTVNENIANGYLGCAWTSEAAAVFETAIGDSLTEAQNDGYDDALVFMEPTGQECFKSKLMALRTTYHNTSTVISPKIITQAEYKNPASIVINGRATGVAQYIGEFRMYDSQTGKDYYCQPIGDVGLMLARIMDKELGGVAPAGTNNNKGCGGVLSRAVLEAKWKWSDAALKTLNQKSVNPITYTAEYGLMLADHRTTQDPENVTDWSYLGHSMSFDLCKREIRDKVMVPQLFKKVNEYYMNIRKKQIDDILAKRTGGSNPMWAEATCDIIGQNTPQTKLKRQFVIKVTCKVNVYSESVLLMFENVAQDA